jgi:hypothetical protein
MNLRAPIFAAALLSLAATGTPCDTDSTGSTGAGTTNVGQNGSVCATGGAGDVTCCVAVNDPCSDNNDCCGGNCTGTNGGDGGIFSGGDGGTVCAEPVNEGCLAALSSRCNEGQCACSTNGAGSDDCCIGTCQMASIPGTSGLRCCLQTGMPCDANGDCCSETCEDSGQCE